MRRPEGLHRMVSAALVSAAAAVAVAAACASSPSTRKGLKEACKRNLDCAYGLECVDASGSPTPTADDGGPAAAGGPRTCQWKSFGDCDVAEGADGGAGPVAAAAQQCLPGYKCREGKCTVWCAGNVDCREGETCRVGVCQRSGSAMTQCYDNRDCPWPETCFYGQCVTRVEGLRCASDLDCQAGFRCINGICQ